MDEDFGSNLVTIEDEDGNEFELDRIDTIEYEGNEYELFLPANTDTDDPDYGYIILRIDYDNENGELMYSSVDDEELLVRVYDLFMEKLFDGEDSDEEEDM